MERLLGYSDLTTPLLPGDREDLRILLRCFLIQKVVHDLGRELYNRTGGIDLILRGMEMLLRECRQA